MAKFRCLLCDKVLDERGIPGHSRSGEHIAKGGVSGKGSEEAVRAFFEEVDAPVFADEISKTEAAPSAFVQSITEPPDERAMADLERRLAEAEAKAAAARLRADEAEAKAKKLSPVEEHPFLTAENAVEELGEDAIRRQAEDRVAAQNRKRLKDGYPTVNPNDPAYLDWVEEEKVKVVAEAIENQTRWVKGRRGEGIKTKTLKMIHPNGTPVQIIAESQVNSRTGDPTENIRKQRDKGYKIMSPLRCYLYDCWAVASVDSSGRLTNGGYCSVEHRALIDGDQVLRKTEEGDQTLASIGYAGRNA